MNTNIQTPFSFDNTAIAFQDKSDRELRRMYRLFALMNRPGLVNLGTALTKQALRWGLPIQGMLKKTIFDYFCGGETIQESEETVARLNEYGIGAIMDYSVEAETSKEGFDHTLEEILKTVHQAAHQPKDYPFCVFKMSALCFQDVLAKLHEGKSLSEEETQAWERAKQRVIKICQTAYDKQVRILIDAEETWLQDPVDELAYEMMEAYNQETPLIYNTFQFYTRSAYRKLESAHLKAVRDNYYLGAKLVRGAYMEKERERADRLNYPDPIQPSKKATDQDFDRALKFCVDKKQRIAICLGSHNEQSNYYLTLLMDKYNIAPGDPNFYFAQLYGMSDHISYNLAAAGYNVAKYVPYGPVSATIPYLFRRAEENTSVAGQSSREFSLIKKEWERRKKL